LPDIRVAASTIWFEFIQYDEDKSIVQINDDKHFKGISPGLWNYQLGGYQVLQKYLKD
jgi:hypothetical protein